MGRAAQTSPTPRAPRRSRRLIGRCAGALLASLFTLTAGAQAARPPALSVPAASTVSQAAATTVQTVSKSIPAVTVPTGAASGAALPAPTPKPASGEIHAIVTGTLDAAAATPRLISAAASAPTLGAAPPSPAPPPAAVPLRAPAPPAVPKVEPPKVYSLPAPTAPLERALEKLTSPPRPGLPAKKPAGVAPASVPAATPGPTTVVTIPAAGPTPPRALGRSAHGRRASGPEQGAGGVLARAESSGPPARAASAQVSAQVRAPHREVSSAPSAGFALIPVPTPVDLGSSASRPDSLAWALAPLEAGPSLGGDGVLGWLLVLALGALLIAAMCADAVGAGPRHDYLRRRRGRGSRWLPWR